MVKIKDSRLLPEWKPRARTVVDSLSAPAAREERIYNTTTTVTNAYILISQDEFYGFP
ncbi:hypothetical protein YC2023_087055 [Brassica napus]